MMKVTREQAAEVINALLLGWALNDAPEALDMAPVTPKLISGNRGYGEIMLVPNGTKLYRYRDSSGSPAYAIMGTRSDGADVSELLALLPKN